MTRRTWPPVGARRRYACYRCYRVVEHEARAEGFDMVNPPTKWEPVAHDCDPRRPAEADDLQCPFVVPNGHDGGVLCCFLIAGHEGDHVDAYGYEHGDWSVPV